MVFGGAVFLPLSCVIPYCYIEKNGQHSANLSMTNWTPLHSSFVAICLWSVFRSSLYADFQYLLCCCWHLCQKLGMDRGVL